MRRALLALALSGCAAQSLPSTPHAAGSPAMIGDRQSLSSIVYSNRFISEQRLCVFILSQGYRVPVIQVRSKHGAIVSLTVRNELNYSPLNVWLSAVPHRDPDAQVPPRETKTFTFGATSQIEIEQAFDQEDGGAGAALVLGKTQ